MTIKFNNIIEDEEVLNKKIINFLEVYIDNSLTHISEDIVINNIDKFSRGDIIYLLKNKYFKDPDNIKIVYLRLL